MGRRRTVGGRGLRLYMLLPEVTFAEKQQDQTGKGAGIQGLG